VFATTPLSCCFGIGFETIASQIRHGAYAEHQIAPPGTVFARFSGGGAFEKNILAQAWRLAAASPSGLGRLLLRTASNGCEPNQPPPPPPPPPLPAAHHYCPTPRTIISLRRPIAPPRAAAACCGRCWFPSAEIKELRRAWSDNTEHHPRRDRPPISVSAFWKGAHLLLVCSTSLGPTRTEKPPRPG